MIIKNWPELAITRAREQVLDVIEAGIASVLPRTLMGASLRLNGSVLEICGHPFNLSRGRIFAIGGGKAASSMARELERTIGAGHIAAGIVSCNYIGTPPKKIEVVEAGHPIPDRRSMAAVRRMEGLKERYGIGRQDLVICLLSGGGSALMTLPAEGVTLGDKQEITKLLLRSGAKIQEINTVRKHLSAVKGGQLGRFFSPARVLSLIISDVVGDDLGSIASGPTYPDRTTFTDACNVLKKYGLVERAPERVMARLRAGCRGEMEETPKELNNCRNLLIGNNTTALEAMEARGRELGLDPFVVTAVRGETGYVARRRAREVIAGRYRGHNLILLGGETTPRLPQKAGKGGRNQHYALVSMEEMGDYRGEWVVASVGTDGVDYLKGVAGAIVDSASLTIARRRRMDIARFIKSYSSNGLLRRLRGSLVITENTGTNVGDLIVYLVQRFPNSKA